MNAKETVEHVLSTLSSELTDREKLLELAAQIVNDHIHDIPADLVELHAKAADCLTELGVLLSSNPTGPTTCCEPGTSITDAEYDAKYAVFKAEAEKEIAAKSKQTNE